MKLGMVPCVIPTWRVHRIEHASTTHLPQQSNTGIVPPWLEPPSNLVPLPGPDKERNNG